MFMYKCKHDRNDNGSMECVCMYKGMLLKEDDVLIKCPQYILYLNMEFVRLFLFCVPK